MLINKALPLVQQKDHRHFMAIFPHVIYIMLVVLRKSIGTRAFFILSIWRLNMSYAPIRPVCSGAIRPDAVMGDAGGLRVEQCGGVGEE